MRLVDIAALADICRGKGVLLLIDNTFCTPYLQRPIALELKGGLGAGRDLLSGGAGRAWLHRWA